MSFDIDLYFNRIPDNFSSELLDEANALLRAPWLNGKFEAIEIAIPDDWQQSLHWFWHDSKVTLTQNARTQVEDFLFPEHIKARLAQHNYACHVSSSFGAGPVLLAFGAIFAKHCDGLVVDYQCVPEMMGFLDQVATPKGEDCYPDMGIYDAEMALRIFQFVTQPVPD